MKLEDTFTIEKSTYGRVGQHLGEEYQYPSITNKPINSLISLLNSKGAEINTSHSEKEATYVIRCKEKQTTIPLDIDWDSSKIKRYFLRGEGIEIELNDYQSSPLSNMLDGESFTSTKGVHCKLEISGKVKDFKKFDEYKNLIMEFYEIKNSLSD